MAELRKFHLEDVDKTFADCPIDLDAVDVGDGPGESILQVLILQRVDAEPEGSNPGPSANHLRDKIKS